ncbi:hypothetical protein [Breznakiella homolactica]|uniref:DUF3828 domain-containing protein n=1 Tax=Breznakiella homolactica TaxID=2798577 RepID=A0A7T7XRF5_9SPIR|nr:hypothetical protein [Breznakiella homolactica]QQO11115.1 hypothetical protein JFL75_09410 [Breznakiella homolactica]
MLRKRVFYTAIACVAGLVIAGLSASCTKNGRNGDAGRTLQGAAAVSHVETSAAPQEPPSGGDPFGIPGTDEGGGAGAQERESGESGETNPVLNLRGTDAARTGSGDGNPIPEQIRRPVQGESLRYPEDMLIGELGRGSAPQDAYQYARRVVQSLVSRDQREAALLSLGRAYAADLEVIFAEVSPQRYRIGGGREENDGSVSFLVRFIGRDTRSAGELYIRQADGSWSLEDLLLEEPRDASQDGERSRFTAPSYERFY